MIELNNIVKVVNVNQKSIPILNNISLKVEKNDFLVITGKSGSGKSSLLNVIGGFDSINSGRYTFKNKTVKNEKNRLDIRREIGYVTQNYALINDESVEKNILLALGVRREYKKYVSDIDEILNLLDIYKLKHIKVSKLSGGEKQRVAIARAIIKKPELLIFDEPTGNLDEENSEKVIEIIRKIHANNCTIIMVTHESDYIKIGNKSIKLIDGEIV